MSHYAIRTKEIGASHTPGHSRGRFATFATGAESGAKVDAVAHAAGAICRLQKASHAIIG